MSLPGHLDVVIIAGSAEGDRIMHSVDLFKASKVLATVEVTGVNVNGLSLKVIIDTLLEAVVKNGYRVVAIFAPNHHDYFYVDHTVKAVSDGHKWCLLRDLIQTHHGPPGPYISHEERQFLTEIKAELGEKVVKP